MEILTFTYFAVTLFAVIGCISLPIICYLLISIKRDFRSMYEMKCVEHDERHK